MTDKEKKQIDEMARIIHFDYWGTCGKDSCSDCPLNLNGLCKDKEIADRLYEQGYHKIPEGSVVVSKEEYKKDFCSQFNKGYEQARKETARVFVNLPDSDILVVDTQEYGEIEVVSIERLQELAKQFGVEIKE